MNELEQALRHPDVIRNEIKQNGRRAVTEAYSPDNPPPYPVTSILDAYPVGSIYMSTASTSPAVLFGGTWTQLEDRFLLGAGTTYTAGSNGGSATHDHTTGNHTLTVSEMPSHTHGVQGWRYNNQSSGDKYSTSYTKLSDAASSSTPVLATGGGEAHNHGNTGSSSNMPPYLVVYMWERTA